MPRHRRHGAAPQALPHARRHFRSATCRDPHHRAAACAGLQRTRSARGHGADLARDWHGRCGAGPVRSRLAAQRKAGATRHRHARERHRQGGRPRRHQCLLESAPARAQCHPRPDRTRLGRRAAGRNQSCGLIDMRRTLIRSATIISMDAHIGDLRAGDLLIENGRIAEVRPGIELGSGAAETEIVDGRGRIVSPGLINAHMHTWQTALRGYAANWTLREYVRRMHAGLATVFQPDDIYIATLMGGLNQINVGTTTLVDWCHNNPTPAHTDAAVRGLFESGIRAAFFHGSPKPEPKPGRPHFSEIPHPRREVERLLAGPLADRNGLVTLGLAILGPHYSTLEVSAHDFALAKELGLVASMHQGGGEAKTPGGWEALMTRGLVGSHVNIVHGNNLTDSQLKAFVDLGV